MPVSQFPTLFKAAHPAEPAGPRHTIFYEMEPEYSVTTSPPFADGGMDWNLNADVKVRRWVLIYQNISEAEAAILDAHMDEARYSSEGGSGYGFDFREPVSDTLHSSVHYDRGGYERSPHTRRPIQSRRVLLCKRP